MQNIREIDLQKVKGSSIKSDLPSKVFIPDNLEDSSFLRAAVYRVNGRVPCLSYSLANGFTLWRSSQPLFDFLNPKRCKQDELYLSSISKKLHIFSSSSEILENPAHYKGVTFHSYDLNEPKRITKAFQRAFKYANNFFKPAYNKKFR